MRNEKLDESLTVFQHYFFCFRWLYLANKKHGTQNSDMNNKEIKEESKPEKVGVENKAFEADEKKTINNEITNNATENIDSVNQSQIEMGFTESMLCTSKL